MPPAPSLSASLADGDGGAIAPAGEEGFDVPPRAAWTSVWILVVFCIVSMIDRQVIALLVDDIKRDLHLSDTQLGLLQGIAFSIIYSLAAIPLGWAVDRYPRRIIIFLGVTLWSLSAAACGLATRFGQLFAARMAVGIGEATLTPAAVSLISDIFPREKVGTAMGVYASGSSLGSGLSLIVCGLVVGLFAGNAAVMLPGIGAVIGPVMSWQAVFIVIGLPGVLVALLAFCLIDPRSGRSRAAGAGAAGGLGDYLARHWRVVSCTFMGLSCASVCFYAVGAWTPAFLSRTFGLAPAQIGLAWGIVVALSGAGGALLGGRLIDRGYRLGVVDSFILVPALAALLACPCFIAGYQLASLPLTLASLGLGTMMVGVVSAGAFTTLQRIAPPSLRGRLSAYFGLTNIAFGAGLGPLLTGLITDHLLQDEAMVGLSIAIVAASALAVLSATLLAVRRPLRALAASPASV